MCVSLIKCHFRNNRPHTHTHTHSATKSFAIKLEPEPNPLGSLNFADLADFAIGICICICWLMRYKLGGYMHPAPPAFIDNLCNFLLRALYVENNKKKDKTVQYPVEESKNKVKSSVGLAL